jgi:hypothetical protein
MKRFYAAAGALLLGTSTLALAADIKTVAVEPTKVATEADLSWDKSSSTTKSETAFTTDTKHQSASLVLDKDVDKLAMTESHAVVHTAALDGSKAGLAWSDDAKLQTASMDTKVDSAWTDSDKLQTASADAAASVETISDTSDKTAMGGPLVQGGNATVADLTPRPATQNYPPCTPGAGDDSCIQLYEPGVRAQLASWNAPTGGLGDGQATTAMGGPFEPVESVSADVAMNGDGLVDADAGEIRDLGVQTAAATEPTLAEHSDNQGVGGPVEAQSGYPPCSPGPGDDRCIQLYESGVTGAGN